ncbi:IclR family transcriptional regulator [Schumannella luteola]|jgi:DNA-binding IclR family transcriptional regulator
MTTPDAGSGPAVSRTLLRGLAILEIVAEARDGIGVTEVAARAGLDKGTVSRLLATLRQKDYVQQRTSDRRFELGARSLWLAAGYRSSVQELAVIAHPFLSELRDLTQETVHLAALEDTSVVYVAQEQPDRSIRAHSAVGTRMPLERTAMGRAALAALDADVREARLRALESAALARGEGFDLDALRADVDAAAARGWASVDRNDDVLRLAAAVLGPDGSPVAALTLSGPAYRMEPELERLGAQLIAAADRLNAALRG